jgi:hypothetical protein
MGRPSRKITNEQADALRINPPRVMNTAQAGAYIGSTARGITALISRDRTFPAKRLSHRGEWKILLHELDSWLMGKNEHR